MHLGSQEIADISFRYLMIHFRIPFVFLLSKGVIDILYIQTDCLRTHSHGQTFYLASRITIRQRGLGH